MNTLQIIAPPPKDRLADWGGKNKTKDKKQDITIYCLMDPDFFQKETYRLTVKGWKKLLRVTRV